MKLTLASITITLITAPFYGCQTQEEAGALEHGDGDNMEGIFGMFPSSPLSGIIHQVSHFYVFEATNKTGKLQK